MTTVLRLAALGLLATGLAACSGVRESLGVGKATPDEFAVTTQPPLVLPPDFELRPPQPGAPALGERVTQYQAQSAVLGRDSLSGAQPSAAEQALVSAAGADKVDPKIRAEVNRDAGLATEKEPELAERILFWQNPAQQPAPVVDPASEAARIESEKAAGQTVTGEGAQTKPADEEDGGWFDWF